MDERTIPILPCADIDVLAPFYEALGFTVTYRQKRPNPYLCVVRGGLDLHFFGFEGHNPEASMATAIVLVPDTSALFEEFAAGLREMYGRLPLEGFPRITRPRVKQGVGGGFSLVDPAGNWLRVSSPTSTSSEATTPLGRVLETATRQGDARGDVAAAISVLANGLTRHEDAPAVDRAPLIAYLAELLVRSGDRAGATVELERLRALDLSEAERQLLASDLSQALELEPRIADE